MTQNICKNQTSQQFIGKFQEAPQFSKESHLISKGYRINFNTPRKIFRSLFMIHNQTLNIWIHLLAALLVIFILGYFLWDNTSQTSKQMIKMQLKNKLSSYLDKLSLFGFGNNTRFSQIAQSLSNKYQQLSNITAESYQSANKSIVKILVQMEKLFNQSVTNLIKVKQMIENEGAKQIVDAIDNFGEDKIYIHQFRKHIKQLSERYIATIDSPVYDFMDLTQTSNPENISRWPVVVMMISAIICLLCSATFHLFYPMAGKYYLVFARLDYAGINILMFGSVVPTFYYGLYCHPYLAELYIICTGTLASSVFILSLFQFMHTPKFRIFKTMCYVSFGTIVAIPLFHMIINETYFNQVDQFSFLNSIPLFLGVTASYVGGIIVYVNRCPQRQKPGRHDICGHSHQIWHVAVVMGVVFTYLAALQNFDERKKYPYCQT